MAFRVFKKTGGWQRHGVWRGARPRQRVSKFHLVASGATVTATINETLPSQTTSGEVAVGSAPIAFGSYPALTATGVDKSLSAVMLSGAQNAPQLLEQFALSLAATPAANVPAGSSAYGMYWNTGTNPGLYFSNGVTTYELKLFS